MRYILMDYVNESGWPTLTRAEQEHWLGAYGAYMEAMTKAGVLKSISGLQPTASATTVRVANGKTRGAGRSLCRLEVATGWLSYHRGGRSRRRDLVGGPVPDSLHGVVEVRPVMEGTLLTTDMSEFIEPA